MTIPNMLSAFRLLLVPVFINVYFSGAPDARLYAVLVYALASLTDVLDGFIARKYHLTSKLGRILDPLGDKLMAFAVLLSITIDEIVPLWALLALVIKESLMGIGGFILHKRIKNIPPSNFLGKSSTVIFFIVCVILMIFPNIPKTAAAWLISFAVFLTLAAFISYLQTFLRAIRQQDEDSL